MSAQRELAELVERLADGRFTYVNAYESFRKEGWSLDGSEIVVPEHAQSPDERFNSFSKGEFNCIITDSESFFKRFMAATAVAQRLNLLDKSDRIALFQAVLYANGEPK